MKRLLIVVLPLVLVVVLGCPRRQAGQDGPAELKRFTSATELKQYLADQYNNRYGGGLFGGLFGCSAPNMESRDPLTAGGAALDGLGGAPSASSAGAAGDYSGTNLQELGVDESDYIKTDGTYLYVVAKQKLSIVQAVPADAMKVTGSLDLDLPGKELYLGTGQAVVLAEPKYPYYYYGGGVGTSSWGMPEPTGGTADSGSERPWLTDQQTFDVYLVDVANPAAPSLTKKYSFQGSLMTSRMVGAKLYLVSVTYPDTTEIVKTNGVAKAAVEDILPKYRVVQGGHESVQPVVGWQDVYHPANPYGYSVVTVTTVDTTNPDAQPVSTSAMADYGVIYASTQALYITSTNYDSYGYERSNTEVHKFDLTGEAASYVASGKVPGWLLNQFSMGEKDGFLRVASTEGHSSGGFWVASPGSIFSGTVQASENHVVVLEQVDNKLEVAGQIDGIAPGEELYAARFVGDRGFLVTFKKIDPLFTVDLADPHNPKVVGELKVPGYSEYIHLMDENHLLTIGKDADDQGEFAWYTGVKLSIFDVSDLANPQLLHNQTLGVRGTDSEALHNHKAFTYYNGLLAFPIDLYEGSATPPNYGDYTFGGLMVYRVSLDKGFEYAGRISTVNQSSPWNWDYGQWTRGVFIGQSVYAACEHDIKAAAFSDMSLLQSTVDLP